jgi:hypothetical protein
LARDSNGRWNIVFAKDPEKLGIGLFVISEVLRDEAFRPLVGTDIDIPYSGDTGCTDVAVIVACGTCGACIGAALAGIPPAPPCVGACLACGYCAGREIADALHQYCVNQGCTGSWPNCDCGGGGGCSDGGGPPLI